MKHLSRHTLALAAVLALAAPCSAQAASTQPGSDLAQARAKALAAPARQAHQGEQDARLFYEVLLGEMSAQNGDAVNAFAMFMNAAKRSGDARLFARAAGVALQARDGQAALLAAQGWRKLAPDSRDAARLELQVLVGLNRMADTVGPIQATIANSPVAEKPAFILALPVVFARAADKAESIRVVDQALAPSLDDPKTASAAWVSKSRMRLMAGDSAGAVQALGKAQQADPGFDAVPILALELMEAGQPDTEAVVTQFLAKHKQVPVRLAYAKTLLDAKRLDDAQTQIKQATVDNPKFADGWLLAGELHMQRRQWQPAEHALQMYLQTAKQSGIEGGTPRGINAALLSLTDLALRSQREAEARALLQRFGETDATPSQLYRAAKLHSDLGDAAAGSAMLSRLPETSDDERRDKTLLQAQWLRDTGQPREAWDLLKPLLEREPEDTNVLYDAALAAEKAGDKVAMERYLRRIIEVDPKHYNAYNALGYSYAERGVQLNEARQLLGKALALSPDSAHVQDSMGWLEFRSGNLDEALRLLTLAYASFPDAEVAAHLGEVLWAKGDKAKAEAIWQEGLETEPKHPGLRETMQRLRGAPVR
jgi:tetratricopeptide (TPR) repeat protein